MLIAFVHESKSFLPEILAYTKFFTARGIECRVTNSRGLQKLNPTVAWHFMGIDRQKKTEGVFTIHEYLSASTPPAATLKNKTKRVLSTKPDHRVFLNEFVRTAFGFNDGVPYSYREMGVPAEWLLQPLNAPKEYDFIYIGELLQRGLDPVLKAFANGSMKEHTLLVLSGNYGKAQEEYASARNIFFEGPVPHDMVRTFIGKARFALNIMPDASPFNQQTSTKLLEYCACKAPVITTDYFWVRTFQQQYGGNFFYLEKDLSNFNWETIAAFNYEFPDLSAWTWEQQIERSGLPALLAQKFPELRAAGS
jgi:Glycosyl transferases group 1